MTVIFENHQPFKKQNKQAHKKLLGGENDPFVLMLLTLSVKRERIDKPEVFFLKRHTKTLSQLCALLFYLGKSCKRYTTSHIFHYCNANAISITNTLAYFVLICSWISMGSEGLGLSIWHGTPHQKATM